jgi:hypothetical protein
MALSGGNLRVDGASHSGHGSKQRARACTDSPDPARGGREGRPPGSVSRSGIGSKLSARETIRWLCKRRSIFIEEGQFGGSSNPSVCRMEGRPARRTRPQRTYPGHGRTCPAPDSTGRTFGCARSNAAATWLQAHAATQVRRERRERMSDAIARGTSSPGELVGGRRRRARQRVRGTGSAGWTPRERTAGHLASAAPGAHGRSSGQRTHCWVATRTIRGPKVPTLDRPVVPSINSPGLRRSTLRRVSDRCFTGDGEPSHTVRPFCKRKSHERHA